MNTPDTVIFAIPVKARTHTRDWDQLTRNLAATVRSVHNSSSPQWEIIIATNDPDDLAFLTDAKTTILPVSFDRPLHPFNPGLCDKNRKRHAIARSLRQRGTTSFYVAFLDADDYVHQDLVEYVIRKQNPNGYLITRGYLLDSAKQVLVASSQFHRRSGSCFVGHYQRSELPAGEEEPDLLNPRFMAARKRSAILNRVLGIHLVPFHAAIHLRGHSESISISKRETQRAYESRQSLLSRTKTRIRRRINRILRAQTETPIPQREHEPILSAFGLSLPPS